MRTNLVSTLLAECMSFPSCAGLKLFAIVDGQLLVMSINVRRVMQMLLDEEFRYAVGFLRAA
ncbi:MAG: hypothetical protein QXK69_07620 [Candidatus Caldarchaeum sp.]